MTGSTSARRRGRARPWAVASASLTLALARPQGTLGFQQLQQPPLSTTPTTTTGQQRHAPLLATAAGGSDDAPRYAARGVSANKGEVWAAVRASGGGAASLPSLFPDAFCRIVPDVLTGDPEHAMIMHADGAGSKAALAYLYWRETGDLSVWKGIAQDALVMNLDDVFCCGATGPALVTSAIARNRRLVPGEVVSALISGLEAMAAELRPWGVEVAVAGGETADLGDLVRTVAVDCTLATRVRRSAVIDNRRIRPGDLIVGLASSGPPAAYERSSSSYNSGIGSNGLTAARHDVLGFGAPGGPRLAGKYPDSYDPHLPPELAYCGSRALTEPFLLAEAEATTAEEAGMGSLTVGQLLLSPTRTYAPILARLLSGEGREGIHGLVHCTGGGQTKVLRCLPSVGPQSPPLRLVKDGLFVIPPVFDLIHEEQRKDGVAAGGTVMKAALWREMYQVFNMGHRMEAYVDGEAAAQRVIEAAAGLGVAAQVVGRVERGEGPGHSLVVHSPHGTFSYT